MRITLMIHIPALLGGIKLIGPAEADGCPTAGFAIQPVRFVGIGAGAA